MVATYALVKCLRGLALYVDSAAVSFGSKLQHVLTSYCVSKPLISSLLTVQPYTFLVITM